MINRITYKILPGVFIFALVFAGIALRANAHIVNAQEDEPVTDEEERADNVEFDTRTRVRTRISPTNILPANEVPLLRDGNSPRDNSSDVQTDARTELRLRLLGQDDDSSTSSDAVRGEAKNRMDAPRSEEERATHLAEVKARAEARIMAYFERMVIRIEAAFDRMERLIERTESRITKLEENGLETEASLEFVAEAKLHLEDARAELQVAVETMGELDFNLENPREFFLGARASVREAIESLKESREALKNAVRVLKAEVSTNTEVEVEEDDNDEEESDDQS